MRPFEILLIAISTIYTFQSFLKFSIKNIETILLIVSVLLLVIHLGFESLRWQMSLVYIVITLLVISNLFNFKIDNKIAKWLLSFLGIFSILISTGFSYFIPVFSIPKTNGKYNLISANESTKNDLVYKIWFPTEQNISTGRKDTYHSNSRKNLNGVMGMPGFIFSHLELVKTNSTSASKIESIVKKPLIIYSHGANSTHIDNTLLIEEIASNGYIVVALNHRFKFETYDIDVQEDKKIEINTQKALIDKLLKKVVPSQVTHYSELIIELKEKYQNQIDFSKIALIGHSLGGATATSGGLKINNVRAVVNMDGPIDKAIVSDYHLPLLYLSSFSPDLTDNQLKALKVPAKFYREVKNYELESVKELFNRNTSKKNWVRFKSANHLDFTDIPYLMPLISAPNYNKQRGHQLKSKLIVSFLNRELKGSNEKIDSNDETIEWQINTTHN